MKDEKEGFKVGVVLAKAENQKHIPFAASSPSVLLLTPHDLF